MAVHGDTNGVHFSVEVNVDSRKLPTTSATMAALSDRLKSRQTKKRERAGANGTGPQSLRNKHPASPEREINIYIYIYIYIYIHAEPAIS